MGPLKSPPPVRRIVVDDEPTIVEPPKRRGGTAQAVKDAASGLLSAPRKREGRRGEVKMRMQTEDLGVAYAGKPAVKAVNLPVNLPTMLRQLEDAYIRAALTRTQFNKKEAAKLLGMGRTTLVEKLRRRNLAARSA